MRLIAEIFSQGEEVVSGQTLDSNAAWLAEQLTELGFKVKRHTAVGDNLDDLIALCQEIAVRADCCICSGGLGPTIDDLTAQAVSKAAGLNLQFDPRALEQIQHYFSCRQRPMPEGNRKQAFLPESALRIDNGFGTAPGFALRLLRCWFVFLPGVPTEMQGMFSTLVRDDLLRRFKLQADNLVTIRSIGLGESAIAQSLAQLVLPAAVQLGFRAKPDEVQTKLVFPAGFPQTEKQACVSEAAALIGDFVFAIDGLDGEQGDLIAVISRLMSAHALSLAVLETATQGLIAAKCVTQPWLKAAEICLDLARISALWRIDASGGDLSFVAQALAVELQTKHHTDFALVQLYIGETADYRNKDRPIVLYNALSTECGVIASRQALAGPLKNKQNQAALLALDLLRRYLQNKCL
jgi:competence/damage-inducible protein CinA-like protein